MNYLTYEQKFRKKALDSGYSENNILTCLSYAKNLIETRYPVIYNSSHFSSLVGYKRSYLKRANYFTSYFYREFNIKKKNGKPRAIKEPLPSLKEIQNWILTNILYNFNVSKFAKAYIPKRTIVENVRFHKGQEKVLCIDISNFFPSITEEHVFLIFKNMGYSNRVANMLAKLCCLDESLPQGAPTSPQLLNIHLFSFDKVISGYCMKNKIRYTRYADDMAFSGSFDDVKLLELLTAELLKKDLTINPNKTKVMSNNMRQVVTGIVVNDKIQVPKEKRKEIRQAIYFIEKFGLSSHLKKIECSKSNYLKHLLGLVNYVLFINPNDKEAKLQKDFLISLLKSTVANNVYKK